MRVQLVHLLLLVLIAAAGCTPAAPAAAPTPPAAQPGTLVVEPEFPLTNASPYLLGSNYGPWVALPPNRLEDAYASGITAIRFPGGEWGDRNVLKEYEIDAFMDLCQKMSCTPVFSVRLLEGEVEAAVEMLRYTNLEKGYGVEHWIIGNEPTLYATHMRNRGIADDYDTVQFNQEWREFAVAMKAVDPNIKLIGPEIHQFTGVEEANPKDAAGRDWMVEFLKANGDLVDVVSFHRYPFPRTRIDTVETVADLRQNVYEWDQTIAYLRQLAQEHAGRDLPIAITEINTHWTKAMGGEATPESHYAAVWLAALQGRLMKNDVYMFNHWLLTAPPSIGAWGMLTRNSISPSYYTYQLLNHFGREMVYAESGEQEVEIYAGRRTCGRLSALVINLGDSPAAPRLLLEGKPPVSAELWQLSQEHPTGAVGVLQFGADGTIDLPAQSVTLLVFD